MLSAGREAGLGIGAPVYVRHRLEQTLLYQIVEEYYPAFKRHLETQEVYLPGYAEAGKVAGFSLHAGIAARADQRAKLERLCRYIRIVSLGYGQLAWCWGKGLRSGTMAAVSWGFVPRGGHQRRMAEKGGASASVCPVMLTRNQIGFGVKRAFLLPQAIP